jgi:hypothetical protein
VPETVDQGASVRRTDAIIGAAVGISRIIRVIVTGP